MSKSDLDKLIEAESALLYNLQASTAAAGRAKQVAANEKFLRQFIRKAARDCKADLAKAMAANMAKDKIKEHGPQVVAGAMMGLQSWVEKLLSDGIDEEEVKDVASDGK